MNIPGLRKISPVVIVYKNQKLYIIRSLLPRVSFRGIIGKIEPDQTP